jgi:hypothetical protein
MKNKIELLNTLYCEAFSSGVRVARGDRGEIAVGVESPPYCRGLKINLVLNFISLGLTPRPGFPVRQPLMADAKSKSKATVL